MLLNLCHSRAIVHSLWCDFKRVPLLSDYVKAAERTHTLLKGLNSANASRGFTIDHRFLGEKTSPELPVLGKAPRLKTSRLSATTRVFVRGT